MWIGCSVVGHIRLALCKMSKVFTLIAILRGISLRIIPSSLLGLMSLMWLTKTLRLEALMLIRLLLVILWLISLACIIIFTIKRECLMASWFYLLSVSMIRLCRANHRSNLSCAREHLYIRTSISIESWSLIHFLFHKIKNLLFCANDMLELCFDSFIFLFTKS